MLYAFCDSHGVPHRRCGKLIVATSTAELAKIEGDPSRRAMLNGVEGLDLIDGNAARGWSRSSPASRRCIRPIPASSTATPSCWRCRATWRIAAA